MDDATPARTAVSKRLRFEIFRRDGHRCRYCGFTADETTSGLTVDHVQPVALGGTNDPSNLITACRDCNAGKASSGPDEHHIAQVADDALRWVAAIRRVNEQAQADQAAFDADVKALGREWKALGMPTPEPGWQDSARRFLGYGLARADLVRYAQKTANHRARIVDAKLFSYFCGICWNEVQDRQRAAQQIVAPTPEPDDLADLDDDHPWYQLGCDLRTYGMPLDLVTLVSRTIRRMVSDPAGQGIEDGHHDWAIYLENDWPFVSMEAELAAFAGGHGGGWLEPAGAG